VNIARKPEEMGTGKPLQKL